MKKKSILVLFATVILTISLIAFFSPDKKTFVGGVFVKMPANAIQRGLTNLEKWKKCFPGAILSDSLFRIGENDFKIVAINNSSVDIESFESDLPENKWKVNISLLNNTDSSFLVYKGMKEYVNKSNFSKLSNWYESNVQRKNYQLICESIGRYLESIEHVYDFNIIQNKVKDSILVSTKIVTRDTPDYKSIYGMIDKLRNTLALANISQVDSPMLNITRVTENEIHTTVAIPIPRPITVSGDIILKKMVLGFKLETEVKGNQNQINRAFNALGEFIVDQSKTSPAMPYQLLITNRLLTPDSLWVTRINYPIF